MTQSPWKTTADTDTGVRDYGLGRHLWALKLEQLVGFEKVRVLSIRLISMLDVF